MAYKKNSDRIADLEEKVSKVEELESKIEDLTSKLTTLEGAIKKQPPPPQAQRPLVKDRLEEDALKRQVAQIVDMLARQKRVSIKAKDDAHAGRLRRALLDAGVGHLVDISLNGKRQG